MNPEEGARRHRALERLSLALGPRAVTFEGEHPPIVVPAGREPARLAAELLAESRVRWSPRGSARATSDAGEVVVASEGLADVYDLWREDLVCRVGAGCALAALQSSLARERMRVPAHAAWPAQTTLGGMFARGERGLRSGPAGGLREAVIGLTAVDGRGELMKAGARVVKNVAGFDLARLHHGARGALGMILDVTLKLEPVPETSAGIVLEADLPAALEAMAQLRRPRTAVDPVALAWLNGPAAAALGLSPRGSLLAVVEGWEATVRCWVGLATAQGGRRDDALESRARDLEWADEPGCGRWSWLAAPSCALRVWPAAEAALVQAGARPRLLLDLLNGHATLALADAGALGATRTALLELVGAQALHGGGGLFVESQAVGLARRVDLPVRAPSPVEVRSKAKFDPHGLLPPIPRPLEALR